MKPTRFLLAAALAAPLSVGAPALAAPAPPPDIPAAPTPVEAIDPAAVKLLDEVAAAYKRLDKLSQTFSIVDKRGDKETVTTGTFMFERPDKARVEVESNGKKSLTISDGTQLISQVAPDSFRKQDVDEESTLSPIATVAFRIPGAATGPFADLLDGNNLLVTGAGSVAVATLSPQDGEDGVTFITQTEGTQPPVTFRMSFDPKTHLLTRVQASIEIKGVQYSNTTTFGAPTATAPASFDFALPAGAKFVEAPPEPVRYDPRLVVGATPFALQSKTLEGKPFSLDSMKGKVVLLDFWATWCGPCIGELPNVQSNYDKYRAQGFDIVAISLDEEEEALRDFVKARKLPWTQIFDGQGWNSGDAQTYGVKAIPFTLLIGKDGKIAAVNPRGAALEPAIKKALAG